jgi:hypothetical protein
MKKLLSALRLLMAGFLLASMATACKDKQSEGVSFNPEFSINLMPLGDKWPGELKDLKPRERAALGQYGPPDFMRILWNRNGSVKIRDQFSKAERERMKKALELPTTWVYVDRNIELVFQGDSWAERKLNDEIRLIARMGDPEAVRAVGGGVAEWTFYSTGRIIKLYNGAIIETREFPAMGGYLK